MVKREKFNLFVKWSFSGNCDIIAENVRHPLSKVVKYNQPVVNCQSGLLKSMGFLFWHPVLFQADSK